MIENLPDAMAEIERLSQRIDILKRSIAHSPKNISFDELWDEIDLNEFTYCKLVK